jgi:hypothetical protein
MDANTVQGLLTSASLFADGAASQTTQAELLEILSMAVIPTLIGPTPVFIDLFRRNGGRSYLPWFVMGFWTIVGVLPILLSAVGALDREKMMYGGYPLWAQTLLYPSFVLPLFYLSTYIFTLAFGVKQPRLFFLFWLGLGLALALPWVRYAFHGI